MSSPSFSIPHITRKLVPRLHLWAHLTAHARVPLLLACAPGGYGKTTTLAAWFREQIRVSPRLAGQVAWYTLEALDNRLDHFVARLIAGVQSVHPGACEPTMQLVQAPLEVNPVMLAHQCWADLQTCSGHVFLVLDDYHILDDEAIHCFVQQLLAERPAIAFFLCGEHARVAQDVSAIATGQAEAPTTTMTPRALYEIVSIIAPLLLLSSLLVTLLILPPARRFAPLTISPPTPPPRLSHA
ncbi:MAG: hypothetical protein EOM24_23420 [Chloroflexia bacterium]|nr:hypothetical protein [Chloroflexia bacterium]